MAAHASISSTVSNASVVYRSPAARAKTKWTRACRIAATTERNARQVRTIWISHAIAPSATPADCAIKISTNAHSRHHAAMERRAKTFPARISAFAPKATKAAIAR